MTMRTPRVVWAAQAPLLLNILTRGPWNLQVADFGDTETLGEMSQLLAPQWDGTAADVRAVFVCSPKHIEIATTALPGVPVFIVAHQGYHQKLPECKHAAGIVCFSKRIAGFIRKGTPFHPIWVIRPFYEPIPAWEYTARSCWSMMSRPAAREPISHAGIDTANFLTRGKIQIYGQDQPYGFLSPAGKQHLFQHCSAYISVLPPRAGFGLAEHEAMSSGCPVVGADWGDIAWLKENSGVGPFDAFRDFGDIFGIAELVEQIYEDHVFAQRVSGQQLDYIASYCTKQSMDLSISEFLDTINGSHHQP